MALNQTAKRGLGALLRQGWNEIPDVIGGSVVALIGVGMAVFGVYNYYRLDGDNRRYKSGYVVFRDDDERAQFVRKD